MAQPTFLPLRLPHLGRIISWYNDFSKYCTQLKNQELGLFCFWIRHLAGVITSSDRLLATGACLPRVPHWYHPPFIQSCGPTKTLLSLPPTLQQMPSQTLKPTLAPFRSLPPTSASPFLPSPPPPGPLGLLPPQNIFLSLAKSFPVRLGVGVGAGQARTQGHSEVLTTGHTFPSEKARFLSEKWAEASLEPGWREGCYSPSGTLCLCKYPKAGPTCSVPLLGGRGNGILPMRCKGLERIPRTGPRFSLQMPNTKREGEKNAPTKSLRSQFPAFSNMKHFF